MKTLNFLFAVMLFTISGHVSAQTNFGGSGQNRMGMDSRPDRNQDSGYRKSENKKEKKDEFEKMMDKMKADLNLDELQFIAIQKTLSDSNRDQNIILKKEISQEDKAAEIIAINKKTDTEINSFLSKEQKEKYKIFNEEKNKRIERMKETFQE